MFPVHFYQNTMWFLFLLITHLLIECNSIIITVKLLFDEYFDFYITESLTVIKWTNVYFSSICVCLSPLTCQDWWFSEVLQRLNSNHPLDHWIQTHLGPAESPAPSLAPALWQETDQRRRHCLSYSCKG